MVELIKVKNWEQLKIELDKASKWDIHQLYLNLNKYNKPLWNSIPHNLRYTIIDGYSIAQESL